MTATLLDDAIGHHIWATEKLIGTCSLLSRAQLRTPVPGTYGSIQDTLGHLVGTDGWYLTFFRPERPNPIGEDPSLGLADFRAANIANGELWTEILAARPKPEADMPEQGDGWIFHAPTAFRLAQVVHHGTDHRSQICTALTHLGLEPPEIDVWAYGEATGRSRAEYLKQP